MTQAKKLAGTGQNTPEVDSRSAISRAYYSLFHETKQSLAANYPGLLLPIVERELRANGESNINQARLQALDKEYMRKVNLHSIFPEVLNQIDATISKDFKWFRNERNRSDYDIDETFYSLASKGIVDLIDDLVVAVKR